MVVKISSVGESETQRACTYSDQWRHQVFTVAPDEKGPKILNMQKVKNLLDKIAEAISLKGLRHY